MHATPGCVLISEQQLQACLFVTQVLCMNTMACQQVVQQHPTSVPALTVTQLMCMQAGVTHSPKQTNTLIVQFLYMHAGAVLRLKNRALIEAWSGWLEFCELRQEKREQVAAAVTFWTHRELAAAFHQFR